MRSFIFVVSILFSLTSWGQSIPLISENNHSSVGFSIPVAGFTAVRGSFFDYSIRLDYRPKAFEKSKIFVEIDLKSIYTGISARDEHLKSADFFEVEKYPIATFISDSINYLSGNDYLAHGLLTMHGVSARITIPFTVMKIEGNTLGVKIRTAIDRLKFKIGENYVHSEIADFLSPEVDLEIDFWTKRNSSNQGLKNVNVDDKN